MMILSYSISNAQNQLTGRISEKETGDAIPGATVYIPDLKTGAVSDAYGIYKIDNLPQTKIIVQVSFLGYKTIIEKIDLSMTKSLDFVMEQAIAEMNEVTVTGTSKATEIKRNPIPIVILGKIELQQNLSTNIMDAVAKLPGISTVTTGPNVSKPFIHGLGYNRVLVLYDGVRQEGQQWGDEHGVEIDENTVDRVEVIKGPASLTYGSDALAGVVNFLSAPPAPDGKVNGVLMTNYQTNNRLYEASAMLTGNNHGLIWGGIASHKQATNYKNKYDGRVYGTAFNETDLNCKIGLNKKWGYSHLNFSLFDDLQEIPDGSRDSVTRKFTKQITEADTLRPIVSNAELNSYKIATLHQHVQHYKFYSSSSFIIGNSKVGLIMGYQQDVRREYSHPEYPEIPGLYLVLKTFTYDIKYYFPEIKGWETTVGINGMYQNNTNKGTEFIIPDFNQLDAGPFALFQKSVNKLDLSFGIRYDARVFKNDAMYIGINHLTGFDMKTGSDEGTSQPFNSYSHTFSGISGSLGATYSLSKEFLVKTNIARGFRSPNVAEISANGVHPGTLIYQIGNAAFKPEFNLQEDIGLSFNSNHVIGYIEAFNNKISNYIFNQKLLNHLGQDSIIVKGNQTFKFNQSEARLYGWEASLDIHPHPFDWLHFENSVSVIYALNKGGKGIQVTDSSKYLPLIPPLHTNSKFRVNIKKEFRHFSSLYIQTGMEYYSKQNRIYSANNTETPTPGYVLFNAGFGADITNRQSKVLANITVLANNITDVTYQSNLSRLKYFEEYPNNSSGRSGIYNMGRNISFKLTVPLNI